MKNSIGIHQAIVSLCILGIPAVSIAVSTALPAADIRTEWQFSTGANPASPEVVVGIGPGATASIQPGENGAGYVSSDPILGSGTGFWDLGISGTITFNKPGGIVGGAEADRPLVVTAVQFYDGAVYLGAATVVVPGATFVSREETLRPSEPGAFGVMLVEKTVWTVPGGTAPETVVLTGLATGSMIDGLTIESSAAVVTPPIELAITPLPGEPRQVEVSWPTTAVGLALQSTADPGNAESWSPVEQEPVVSGDRAKVVMRATDTAQFFRLHKP